ncbi:MAG: stage V sporulation protein AD [Clostridium sp.]|nr:stage V sporulation protein AD [Clostridium sp.]MCM1444258.1 stage V sporulation protein AD [Candidatus Amulumruptor caecigallinarius]
MTIKYDNVYLNGTSTIAGPYESNGPFGKLYDKTYKDFYFGEKSFELAESKLIYESVKLLLKKINKSETNIDLHISGDLLNQITSSNYAASKLGIPFLGIYNACASSTEGIIIASNMVDKKQVSNVIVSVSSHNNSAEKQFRYPVEYGAPKKNYTTFTTTGGASCYISSDVGNIKIESGTIGRVMDMGVKDVFNMGGVMAIAAADTIYTHLKETGRTPDYYDLILTGDLGIHGKDILKEYMKEEYNIILKNYDDSACMIFDINKQPVYSGGSGPACLPLVAYTYILNRMKNNELKKVLLVATGALMSPTLVNLKQSIPSIAHAVSLEVI